MAFQDDLITMCDGFIADETILNYQISDLDENHNTGAVIAYMVNIATDKVEEKYFYVWKRNSVMNFKAMDRLPSR